jgi:uncharacterized protein YndB with AHSA1/START domain
MEHGSIERTIHVDASPEVVFEVVSSPSHIREWWDAETALAPSAGAVDRLTWGRGTPGEMSVAITVVEARPPRLFSFRWVHPDDEPAAPGNSLLVTFELTPSGSGTSLRLTETGFRERGWEVAVLEEAYREHCEGWNTYLPRIARHAARLAARR